MPFTIRQFADDLLGFMDKQRIEETSGRRIYSKTRIRERYFLFKKVLTGQAEEVLAILDNCNTSLK